MSKVILDTAEMEFGEEARVIEPSTPKDSSAENGKDNEFVSFADEHGLTSPEEREAQPPATTENGEHAQAADMAKDALEHKITEEMGAAEPEPSSLGDPSSDIQQKEDQPAEVSISLEETVPQEQRAESYRDTQPIRETSFSTSEKAEEVPTEIAPQTLTKASVETAASVEALTEIPVETATEALVEVTPEAPSPTLSEAPTTQSPPKINELQQPSKELQAEAQNIIQAAKERAAQIVQQAQDETERIIQQATEQGEERGKHEGYQEGYQNGQKALDFAVERLQVITGRLLDQRKRILTDVETHIVDLALLIAKKVVKIIASNNREVVVENVRQALRLLSAERQITIRVNPDDLKLSEEELKRVTAALEKEKTIAFYADATIEKGGCLIESDLGNIDAQIGSQLLELEQQIQGIEGLQRQRIPT